MSLGDFSEEALLLFQHAAVEQSYEFSEGETYDFTRCIRSDGSAYGTGGTCRKGTPGEARKEARVEMIKQGKEVNRLKQVREETAAGEDKKAAAEARRQHIEAKKKLKELAGKHEELRKESGDIRRFGTETNRYKATDSELKAALDSGKLSAQTAEKVRVELAQREAFGGAKKPEGESEQALGKVKIVSPDTAKKMSDAELKSQVENANKAAFGKGSKVSPEVMKGLKEQHDIAINELASRTKSKESGEQPKITATPGMAARVKAAKEKLKAEIAANGGKRTDRIQEERRLEQNRKQREMDQKLKANQKKQEEINSQVSLVTPQKQGKADVDRLDKYIKEEATKFDNQRQAIRDGKAKADDPDVKKNLQLRQRNVNEAMKQRDQLQKEMDKAASTQSPQRPADTSPAAQQRRAAAAARARD